MTPHLHPNLGTFLTRGHFHVGDCGDGSQRFATEPLGREGKEVVRGLQLRRGMPLKAHTGVLGGHARSIVEDLDGSATGIQDVYLNGCGSGIDGILHELLHDRSRSLDDFTSRNLVGHVVGKDVDRLGHPLECMKFRK